MASSSNRKSGSSGRHGPRKRVVIGAKETVRVRYHKDQPSVEAERKKKPRSSAGPAKAKAKGARPNASAQAKRISNAKRDERERRQRIAQVRAAALIAAAVIAVGLVVWGMAALLRAPIFTVDTVEVEGNSVLSKRDVIRLAQVPQDATLLRLPADAIEKRLEASPWISSAEVDRGFPSSVTLRIVERQPAVVVDGGGTELWTVAADGVWLGKVSEVASDTVVVRDLPEFRAAAGKKTASKELLNAIRIVRGISDELRSITRAVSAPTVDKTALITQDDVEIFVGPAIELSKKDRIARSILEQHEGRVVYINVRVTDNATWRGLDAP